MEDAWEACAQGSAEFRRFATAHCSGFGTNAGKFSAALDAHAFDSAAMMLIPAEAFDHAEIYSPDHQTLGWTFHLMSNANFQRPTITGFAATLALAITSASLKARAIP